MTTKPREPLSAELRRKQRHSLRAFLSSPLEVNWKRRWSSSRLRQQLSWGNIWFWRAVSDAGLGNERCQEEWGVRSAHTQLILIQPPRSCTPVHTAGEGVSNHRCPYLWTTAVRTRPIKTHHLCRIKIPLKWDQSHRTRWKHIKKNLTRQMQKNVS